MTIEVSKKYSKKDFHSDLFQCMLIAGTEKKRVIFLLSDKDIIGDY